MNYKDIQENIELLERELVLMDRNLPALCEMEVDTKCYLARRENLGLRVLDLKEEMSHVRT